MKKLVALLLGSAMFAATVAGLAACKPDETNAGGSAVRRADTRATDVYEAYDYEDNKVGAYKTIADAINAVVDADLDFMEDEDTAPAEKGGYVLKKGGTRRLFQNTKGFADGNGDQFWYYENGTMLEGYNCWDNTTGITTLHNTKVVTHKVNLGVTSAQSWNGYGMLDEHGQEVPAATTLAQSWELSAPMDAGVMMFPKRKAGAAGLKYTIDLSEVKITPAYEGVEDPVYAFIGFYLWQDYYVVATGIACDTTTGKWYEFRGTSRDNSFSDIDYKYGNECLMESTWNEDGYFTPNGKELSMQIQSKRMHDDADDVDYWVGEMTIAVKDGKTLSRTFEDQDINALFSGYSFKADTGYVFIAGLDIKNEISGGVDVKNVDYFNGAKFENLCVTQASIYFPTEEEMTDVEYAIGTITPELRGQWWDALLANDTSANGAYDYTLLSNYAFSSYTKENGADYYNFKFDGSPVGDSELGGLLKVYQDQVDSLKNMTVDNYEEYAEVYDEVAAMYGSDEAHTGSTLTQQYLLLMDFTAYKNAESVYLEAMKLSDEAQAVLTDLRTLGNLANYDYKGWETAEADVSGYLWSEAQKFNTISAKFDTLTADEQEKVIKLYGPGQDGYDAWEDLYDSVKAYLDDTDATSQSYTIMKESMPLPDKDPAKVVEFDVTYNGTQALQKLFETAFKIKKEGKNDSGEVVGTMNAGHNANYQASFHLLFLMQKIQEAGVEIPSGFLNTIYAQITNDDTALAFESDFNDYIYPVLTLAGKIYKQQQEGKYVWLNEEIAEIVNDHMVGFEKFTEGNFNWNCTPHSGNGSPTYDLRDADTGYEHYFGLPFVEKNFRTHLKYIIDVVLTCDENAELNASGLGFVAEVTPLDKDPSTNGSDEAKALVESIKALTTLEGYDYKGWEATDENTVGYLYSELEAFRALVADREELPALDKAYVNYQLSLADNATYKANYDAWETLSGEIAAIEETAEAFWTKQFQTVEAGYNKTNTVTFTGEQVLEEIYKTVTLVKAGQIIPNHGTNDASEKAGRTDFTTALDDNFYTAMWTARMVRFALDSGVTLPTLLTAELTEIKYFDFYTQTYYPVMGTLRIAERIGTSGEDKIEAMEDFTEDELAFLNEVWTAGYELKGTLATHWGAGKFEQWWSRRAKKFVQDMGGTLKKEDGTELLLSEYVQVLSDFLAENHYTAKTNGWGTTSDTILGTTLSENALNVVAYMKNLGNITSYDYKGWTAPAEGPIAGYLYSEAMYYLETVKPVIDGLEAEEQEGVILLIGTAIYEAWESLAPEIKTLNEDAAFTAFKVTGANRTRTATQEYTAGDAIGEILTALGGVDSNGINSDNNWFNSLRIYFFVIEFEEAELELPEYVAEAIAAKENSGLATGLNSADLKEDVKYLRTVLKIAKMLKDNPELEITQDIIDMVNATMVGKTRFTENGLNWNYTQPTSGNDLLYRGTDYKMYWGIAGTENFKVLLDSVINFLVENGATATETGFGVTEAMTLPAAE